MVKGLSAVLIQNIHHCTVQDFNFKFYKTQVKLLHKRTNKYFLTGLTLIHQAEQQNLLQLLIQLILN